MKEKITNWNVLDGLRTNTEIAAFLEAAIEEGDYKFFVSALSDAVHAQKINETARNMDVDRESLYKDISNEQNPDYEAIFKAIDWLGLKVSFSPKVQEDVGESQINVKNTLDADRQVYVEKRY